MKLARWSLCLISLFFVSPSQATTPSSSYRNAHMEVTFASGFYVAERSAELALNYLDGEKLPNSLTFTVRGRKLTANVWRTQETRCGDKFYARLNVPNERIVTDVELIDFSTVRCRIFVREKWHAKLSTREPDGSESQIEMSGNPVN